MKKTVAQSSTFEPAWRRRPLAHAIAVGLFAMQAMPVFAAPPPLPSNALPKAAPVWLGHGEARMNTVGNTMTIDQSSTKAILNWDSFNIGKDGKVRFNQPSVNSTALNVIKDGSPTQIFGQLTANGNIYLVNNNGILFGEGAQVNVHGLVASTLNIDPNLFINSSLAGAITEGKAALEGGTKPGAMILILDKASIATDEGGQVMVFAPNVGNAGEIATPGGQTILAASNDKVYLAASDNNPSLRGLLVEVDSGGNVGNVGKIIAERGNITLLGLAVNQGKGGVLRATTSVDVNGSIRLLARDRAMLTTDPTAIAQSLLKDDKAHVPTGAQQAVAREGGKIVLDSGSVTEVVADSSTKTAADAQKQELSRIDLVGKDIELRDGSTVRAKGGKVNLVATSTPQNLDDRAVARNDSRIYLGANSTIDVSGEKVELDMSRRVVAVELRGDELKDAPLQRNGALHGKTVYVDIDKGSPLISDLKPTLAKIQRGVKERTTAGGTIDMVSQGDVLVAGNAKLDISGGSTSYKSGYINTTKLSSDGRIVDIGSADPNRRYDGIFGNFTDTHEKWGKTVYQSKSFATYREGFTAGSSAGSLDIDTQTMYGFDRVDLQAGAVTGPFQRAGATQPARGAVSIKLGQGPAAEFNSVQNVLIGNIAGSALLAPDADYIDGNGVFAPLQISAEQLNRSGVGSFAVRSHGVVKQAADSSIALQPGSTLSLRGTHIEIGGRIGTPGGKIELTAAAPSDGDYSQERFNLQLADGSVLDTSGNWVNDLKDNAGTSGLAPTLRDGGTIALTASHDVALAAGSTVRADAGAQMTVAGELVGGKGGTIALSSSDPSSALTMAGKLSAYGFSEGGMLELTAAAIDIGRRPIFANPHSLWLGSDFFSQNGFGQYHLNTASGELVVHSDASIQVRQQNLQVSDMWTAARQSTGGDVRAFSRVVTLPDYQRAPTGLTLTTLPDNNRNLRVESGARIAVDPRGTIAMHSSGNLFMDGELAAKGGSIDLQITSEGDAQPLDPKQMIWLGSHASLDAGATRMARYSPIGLLDGDIVDAGSVSLFARRGAIVAAPGSRIDVGGASYAQDYAIVGGVQRYDVAAAAGSVSFTAANGIAVFADMHGAAAGGDGLGGSLTYRLDANDRRGTNDNTAEFDPRTIHVVDDMPQWDPALQFDTEVPAAFSNRAIVAADTAQKGGFTSLSLIANNTLNGSLLGGHGSIVFDNDVRLNVRDTLILGATNIDLRDHAVNLRAPIIRIGQQVASDASAKPLEQAVAAPSVGTGELNAVGNFIELFGNIGVGGAQRVSLNSTYDIRLRSPAMQGGRLGAATFSTQGDVALKANQVYGSTLTDYRFSLLGADSTFSATNSGAQRTPVLSAGSKLTIAAPHIDIGGTLLAPLGTIALDGGIDVRLRDTARLDVSANNQLIPFGRIQGGDILWSYAIDPAHPLLIETAPEKRVAITGPSVAMDKGAQIDVSGGGDIYGVEQIPGTGGSRDFLDPANSGGAFAVVPWLNGSISPFDQVEMAGFQVDGKGPRIGDVIYLDAGAGLPAGSYAILPAHYALLEGAYLVTPKAGASEWRPGLTTTRVDGTVWVGGRYGRAFGGGFEGQWQGFAVEPGSVARTRSEYKVTTGDQFFADKAGSASAADAGRVSFEVTDQLDLLGSIRGAAAQGGRKAQLDIIANEIEVVDERNANSTAVQLNAAALNGVGVDSILLGGRRSGNGDATTIDVAANSVAVRGGAKLDAPDILLTARDRVVVDSGATVSATGASTNNVQLFEIEGDGAFLRVSSAGQADVVRTNTGNTAGLVDIASGATVFADRSILVDSTNDMRLDGSIGLKARTDVVTSLNLTANRISLGDGSEAASEGLSFSNAQLNSFNAQALRLSSRKGIDFYGDVLLNNRRVELNAGALRNMQSGNVQLRAADTLQLDNSIGAVDVDSGVTGGKLVLSATSVVVGNGRDATGALIETPAQRSMQLFGFDQVDLGAAGVTQQLIGEGNFKLVGSGNLDVIADRVGGVAGATTAIDLTAGTLSLRAANAAAIAPSKTTADVAAQLGAQLNLSAERIAQGTHIDLPSGVVTMRATGAGTGDNVSLLAGSITDVSGRKLVFPQGSVVASNGGLVRLQSRSGDVVGQAGAVVVLGGNDAVNGATRAGDSGTLDIAAKGRALWQAGIKAAPGAAVDGGQAKGGNLLLDVGGFEAGGLGDWLQRIADSGIDQRVVIRGRSGDLTIDRNVRAADLTLSADSGDIALAANIDARGASGGHVALWAGNDLNIADGARIDAQATAAGGRGGKVELGARDGTLAFGANTVLDVAGRAGAAGAEAGRNGHVLLRAPRTAGNDDVQIANSGATINGAARIELEAFRSYDASVDGTVASVINDAYADAQQFMTNQATQDALKARFAGAAPADVFHVLPGIDLFSTGDLTLGSDVKLGTRRYGAIPGVFDGEAGVLSLRAAGDLIVAAELSDGMIALPSVNNRLQRSAKNVLRRDYSWNYRLVAGADLAAADPGATQQGIGNIVVKNGKDIVTGAGWIGLHAGGSLQVEQATSTIAILGRSDYTRYLNPTGVAGAASEYETLPDTGSIDPYYLTSVSERYPLYPKDGGDLAIDTGVDVAFAKATTFFSDWIHRIANNEMTLGQAVAQFNLPQKVFDVGSWGFVIDNVANTTAATQGVGALSGGVAVMGGGNVDIRAGRDVVNLNALLPVTAKQVGVDTVSIIGGGDLSVVAGGDILSPMVLVDRGRLDLEAGGRIGAGTEQGDLAPLLAISNSQANLSARGDIVIGSVFNSTMMPASSKVERTNPALLENYFFTYSDAAAINANSVQGDVIFHNDVGEILQTFGSKWVAQRVDPDTGRLFSIYPGKVAATAMSRSIRIEDDMTLFPSAKGQLTLLAGTDIAMAKDAPGTSVVKVNLSDADPALLPTVAEPVRKIYTGTAADNVIARLQGAVGNAANPNVHAGTPIHQDDKDPAIIAALGDIAVDGNLVFELAKPVRAYAGRDIGNVTFAIQHSNSSQVSEIIAGRDVSFPLVADAELGTIEQATNRFIRVEGPGRLDVIAGRDIDLGASAGIEASANTRNPALPDHGASVNVLSGMNGPSALTDPVLYSQFADRYLTAASGVQGTYIDWFAGGGFTGIKDKSSATIANYVGAFTGKKYSSNEAALADYRALPVLTQQAIALEAYATSTGAKNYAAALIEYVSLERYNGDLTAAVQAVTGQSYADNAAAAAALAKLPAGQQLQVARSSLDAATPTARRELLLNVYAMEVRAGGVQQAEATAIDQVLQPDQGYGRSYAAIEQMFPGKKWQGDTKLALSVVRTYGDGDINIIVPGGDVDVGLPNRIAGFDKAPADLGIIANGYGEINGIASGSFNINQSRVFALGNGDIMLWSSNGNVDAGKGAKTALSVDPPKIVFNNDGSSTLVYSTPVAGSGIQGGGPDRDATDRGALLLDDDARPGVKSDTRSSRLRYVRSLSAGNSYLFAPQGTVNAGDAGIAVTGNLLIAAQQVLGADNISVGGISIGVPTTTAISAGTLSLGDVASSATETATNSMNEALKDTAAALAESSVAFVTVDIIGVGN